MRHIAFCSALGLAIIGCGGADRITTTPPPPPPPPSGATYQIAVVSGDAQKGPFGAALTAPLVVSVTDSHGNPAANVKVNWGVVAGEGALSAASSTTDQNGKASVSWTLGPSPWVNQSAKAWTDSQGSPSAVFNAKGQATLVIHYDGSAWTRSMLTEQYTVTVNTGWAASPSFALAAGTHCQNPFALTFTNAGWTGMDTCAGTSLTITGLAGTASNDVWAVGTGHGARIMDPDFTWVFHFDGSSWTTSYQGDLSQTRALVAVAPRAGGEVIAVGKAGRIARHTGQQWNEESSGTTNDLLSVWADPNSSAAFAVGAAGTILRYDGAAWHSQASPTAGALHSVYGFSANDVFAVGDGGNILHFDGTSWSAQSSGTQVTLMGVWGSAPNSLFAVGTGGTVLRYNGTAWSPVSTGFQMDFTDVWGTSASDVFVSGH